jgi:phosphatidylglycerophosphatase A
LLDKFGEADESIPAFAGISIGKLFRQRIRPAVKPAITAEWRLGLPKGHPAVLIATGFGIGLIPFAPGSWGSLAGLALARAILAIAGIPGRALALAIVCGAGWWAAGAVAKASGLRDPAAVVVDEIAGQTLVLLAAPRDFVAWALAFVLFRLFDIWKPWPVRWADRRLAGGLGIMLDDFLAAGYALASLWVLVEIGEACGVLG